MAGYLQPIGPSRLARKTRLTQVAALLAAWLMGAQAGAIGLGDPNVSSALGQPLQMTVPLVADPGVELSQECVRLIPTSQSGDAVPGLAAARVLLEPERGQLRIESDQAIQEPVVRVAVEVGCAQRIRREFTLLMDPPALGVPMADNMGNGQTIAAGGAAIGLGMAQISAVMGQRLSMKVPVTGADAPALSADCVRLADPISSEGAPVLRQAQVSVGTQDGSPVIEVVSSEPVTEPAIRVSLDVGCVEPLRREYAILLGLPPLAAAGEARDAALAAPPAAAVPKPAAKSPPKPLARPAVKAPPAEAASAAVTAASAESEHAAAPTSALKMPGRAPDRLVLASAAEAGPAVDAQAVQNAELARRMDEMSHQLQTLSAELAASRARVQELEHRAADSHETWTWLLGALGGVLLGMALAMAWRQRQSAAPSWESVATPVAPAASISTANRARRNDRMAPGIGGRATMAQAPTTVGAPTEPTLPDDRPTEITVTELHDTVQVIKELYATVLERASTTGAGADSRPERPLELDLNAPTGVKAISPRVAPSPTLADAESSAAAPRVLGGEGQGPRRRRDDQPETEGAAEERFTELPTEMAIDLDLGSLTRLPKTDEATTLGLPNLFGGRVNQSDPDPVPPSPVVDPETDKAVLNWREPSGAPRNAPGELPASPSSATFPEEHLTQSPTELSIDLDVGEPSRLSETKPASAASVLPLARAMAARAKAAPPPLAPIDLQLDLTKNEGRRPREDRTG